MIGVLSTTGVVQLYFICFFETFLFFVKVDLVPSIVAVLLLTFIFIDLFRVFLFCFSFLPCFSSYNHSAICDWFLKVFPIPLAATSSLFY